MTNQERLDLKEKYSYLKPFPGIVAIKRVKIETSGIVRSGYSEARSWGRVIAKGSDIADLAHGDLIGYDEMEGQELFKYGIVNEDDIILIRIKNVLVLINEDK